MESLMIGVISAAPQPPALSGAMADIVAAFVHAGGSVLLPCSDPLVASNEFQALLANGESARPTLSYGERPARAGLHLVETESEHVAENLAGLGGSGTQLFVCAVSEHPVQGHPMLPVLQVAAGEPRGRLTSEDIDLFVSSDRIQARAAVWALIAEHAAGQRAGRAAASGLTDFQITRGHLGVTT